MFLCFGLKNWMDSSSIHWNRGHEGRCGFEVRKTDKLSFNQVQSAGFVLPLSGISSGTVPVLMQSQSVPHISTCELE